ncbi:hypothetical protein D3C80_1274750 [compost metagenome]
MDTPTCQTGSRRQQRRQEDKYAYRGEAFVGLYPYVDVGTTNMWVHKSAGEYKNFHDWRQSSDKLRPSI